MTKRFVVLSCALAISSAVTYAQFKDGPNNLGRIITRDCPPLRADVAIEYRELIKKHAKYELTTTIADGKDADTRVIAVTGDQLVVDKVVDFARVLGRTVSPIDLTPPPANRPPDAPKRRQKQKIGIL
jgi:hypothetical protein